MKESARNLLVGTFVAASLVVLGVLMMWFGEAPTWLGGSEWTLRIKGVQELSGVGEGSPVTLNGVEIGRVQRLDFENPQRPHEGVVIVAGIKNTFSVPDTATARVYGATLGFGTGHVAIVADPTQPGEPLDREDAELPGEMRSIVGELISKELIHSLERTISRIGTLAEVTAPVMDELTQLMKQRAVTEVDEPGAAERGVTANISTMVERIDAFVAHLNAVLGDENVQEDVKAAVSDLRNATRELDRTVGLWKTESRRLSDNLNEGIDRTEENLAESFAKLTDVLDNLDTASTSVVTLLSGVQDGQGTMGLFARDARLYEAAVLTLERFSELMASLRRITGKIEEDGYVTIAQTTPVGTFTKKFPVGQRASDAR